MKSKKYLHIIRIYLIFAFNAFVLVPLVFGSSDYEYVDQWGSDGSGDGQFNLPNAIIADSFGYLYVSDHVNHRVQKFDTDGIPIGWWGGCTDPTHAGSGHWHNPGSTHTPISGNGDGQFNLSVGMAIDSFGYLYVGDRYNDRVHKYDTSGNFIGWWGGCDNANHYSSGHWHDPGSGHIPQTGSDNGQFYRPGGLANDSSDNIYVTDAENNRIQKFTSNGTYLLQWGGVHGTGDGEFKWPYGVCVDSSGYVYVADTYNHRIQKFTSDGTFLDKWGQLGSGNGDLNFPHRIQVDSADSLFVVEFFNYRVQVFSTSGDYITKWGSYGSGDGQFWDPTDITFDSFGYVYVTDQSNNRIQKFRIHNMAPAVIDIDPDTLDMESKDKWMTCYIEIPEGYDVSDIDIGSILLEGLFEVQHSDVQNGVLMVKFDRQDVIAYIELVLCIVPQDYVSLAVTGELSDGMLFKGSDTIRVKKE